MDEATRLVCELQGKLAALDNKVLQYRRDMAEEFTKYAEELLRNVGEDVSEKVSKSIAESLKDYKLLGLDAIGSTTTIDSGNSSGNGEANSAGRLQTTWPVPGQRKDRGEEETEEIPRSPHEREIEFQGVFTPAYLPLLDSSDRNERRASDTQSSILEGKGKEKRMDMGHGHVDASTDTRSLTSTPEPPKPPIPIRKNTDEVSLASSELSESGIIRRSALRRSSTSSNTARASPRRVRFEVEGEEVLPTESPYSTQLSMAKDIPSSYQSLDDDSDEEGVSQQIEDIEERPPTRRISSSQRLQQLSRSPLIDDENVQWTTVSAPPDGSASVATSGVISTESSSDDLLFANGSSRGHVVDEAEAEKDSTFTGDSNPNTQESSRIQIPELGPNLEDIQTNDQASESSDSEDDFLNMSASRSTKPRLESSTDHPPPLPSPPAKNLRSPTASTKTPGLSLETMDRKQSGEANRKLRFSADEDDDLFAFDEREPGRRPEPEHEDSDSNSPPASPVTQSEPKKSIASPPQGYAQSPAREIMRPPPDPRRNINSMSSMGSYKGHPFSMPIASEYIQAQAASVGEVNSFVGSVHGRTGLDESDAYSFRLSLGNADYSKGDPKTMNERMLRDEYKEREAAEKEAAKAEAEKAAKAAKRQGKK